MPRVTSYKDPSLDILEASLEQEFTLPRGLLSAIRTRGEKSNSNQTSPKGAAGVYQFMPATWNAIMADRPQADIRDPEEGALAAARYMKSIIDLTGSSDAGMLLSEYNGGPKARKAYVTSKAKTGVGDPGNDETRKYLDRALPFVRQEEVLTSGGEKDPSEFDDGTDEAVQQAFNDVASEFDDGTDEAVQQAFNDVASDADTFDPFNTDYMPDTEVADDVGFSQEVNDEVKLDQRIRSIVDSVING